MIVPEHEVTTPDVQIWEGLTLLNFRNSTCSQKCRILLAEKRLTYRNYQVNLLRHENTTSWFLGINPRGVVPVLVHDGVVHIESNDILAYLDTLPSEVEPFFPQNEQEQRRVRESLHLEDNLHLDLRNLTMGFMLPRWLSTKSEETLRRWESEGVENAARTHQVKWWRDFAQQGIPDDVARRSMKAYRIAFDTLETWLVDQQWLLGERLTVLDIAWFISANRLFLAGYPLSRHLRLSQWFDRLSKRSTFAQEVSPGIGLSMMANTYRLFRKFQGRAMVDLEVSG